MVLKILNKLGLILNVMVNYRDQLSDFFNQINQWIFHQEFLRHVGM